MPDCQEKSQPFFPAGSFWSRPASARESCSIKKAQEVAPTSQQWPREAEPGSGGLWGRFIRFLWIYTSNSSKMPLAERCWGRSESTEEDVHYAECGRSWGRSSVLLVSGTHFAACQETCSTESWSWRFKGCIAGTYTILGVVLGNDLTLGNSLLWLVRRSAIFCLLRVV